MSFLDANDDKTVITKKRKSNKYIAFIGLEYNDNNRKYGIYDVIFNTLADSKIGELAERFKVRLTLGIIFKIFRSYCAYGAKQITNGVNHFHFPNLGTLYKTEDNIKRIEYIIGARKRQDINGVRNGLVGGYYKNLKQSEVEKIIRLKGKQWNL